MQNPVKPIPENFHSVTPNLVCRNAAQAIDFYKAVFGATETVRMPGPDGKIMHAVLKIGDSRIFVNDSMGNSMPASPGPGISNPTYLHVYVANVDAIFNRAVENGARVDMPVQDMFWGDRSSPRLRGSTRDRANTRKPFAWVGLVSFSSIRVYSGVSTGQRTDGCAKLSYQVVIFFCTFDVPRELVRSLHKMGATYTRRTIR